MFIHIWMHWFWITAAYFKGFLLITTHTISFSEAGLLDNETFAPLTPNPYNGNDSSQTDHGPNITSPILLPFDNSPHTTRHYSTSNLQDDPTTEESTTTTRPDEGFNAAFASGGDMPDTFNGGTLDAFQYPLKKFTKHSHPKYTKTRTKGKPSDDAPTEERKADAVKVVEEKININLTIADDGTLATNDSGRSTEEVDKHFSPPDGGTSEVPSTDGPDLISMTVAAENDTAEVFLTLKPSPTPTKDQTEVEITKNETLVIESKVEESGSYTTVEPILVKNRVAAATSAHNYEVEQSELNAGSITGITLGILVVFSLFGAVSFVLYRRRYLNKPEVLHDKCSNLDSSGYIDETSLRENSEEMYSLDNDSFLNSLEAMTIQNYWTESVKHTKL